jgi:hypothetical protein
MTVGEAIRVVDDLEPNQYTEQQKFTWLARLDGQIFEELILTHEKEEGAVFTPPSSSGDELLVPFPYDGIYNYWLQAMIALENGENAKYMAQMQLFNALYKSFAWNYNRKYRPLGAENRMRF